MHDEAAEHADHLLHGHVRVVEEGSALMDMELVDEAAAGGRPAARCRAGRRSAPIFKAVPVDGGRSGRWLSKMMRTWSP